MPPAPTVRHPRLMGVLLGWKRTPMGLGAIVRIQATTAHDRTKGDFVDEYDVALTATQMRTLGEDLIRGADEHEGRPPAARRKWWQA